MMGGMRFSLLRLLAFVGIVAAFCALASAIPNYNLEEPHWRHPDAGEYFGRLTIFVPCGVIFAFCLFGFIDSPARRVGSLATKRPRFGLKLIFLITALVAVCAAWRQAVVRKERADIEAKAGLLRAHLAELEANRAKILDRIKQLGRQPTRGISPALDFEEEEIKTLKDRIDDLTR
jgi:hypothetical protein